MDFLDIHTHKSAQQADVASIQSLSLTSDIFLAMPKTKPISIGLHPWYATLSQLPLHLSYLEVLAKQPNVKMIGECGLDKLKGTDLAHQMIIFEAQIKLAEKLKKPVIVHCVKCFDELIEIKERLRVTVPIIIHGFNKNETMAHQLRSKGFFLSFGKGVLNENAGAAKLVKALDFFFLETDDADVSIQEIYSAVAILKKCSVDDLKARIFASWKKLNLI